MSLNLLLTTNYSTLKWALTRGSTQRPGHELQRRPRGRHARLSGGAAAAPRARPSRRRRRRLEPRLRAGAVGLAPHAEQQRRVGNQGRLPVGDL